MKKKFYTIILLIVCNLSLFSDDVVLVHTEGPPPGGGGHIINIEALNDTTCYAVFSATGATTLYKAIDAGDNWELVNRIEPFDWDTSPQIFNPESAAFPSLDTIYVTYQYGGHIRKSTDGGKTFKNIKLVSTDIDGTYNIAMYDNNIGFVDALDSLLVTFDGWNTFEMRDRKRLDLDTIPGSSISSPRFVDPINMHISRITKLYNYNILTDEFEVIHTIEQDANLVYNNQIIDFQYINNLGYAVGKRPLVGGGSADIIYKTTDKGKNWKIILDSAFAQGGKRFGLQSVSFYDERNGVAVGKYGKVLLTNNGGKSWKYILPDIFYQQETEGPYGPLTMQVCWAGKSPLIATFRGNIYKYVGDYFKFYSPDEMPELIFPENNYATGNKSIKFKWNMKDTLNNIIFKIAKDENFENIVAEKTLPPNTKASTENLPESFTKYYWMVGVEKEDDIFWSNSNVFSIDIESPQMTNPSDSSTHVAQNSFFKWTNVIGAKYYTLEIAENPYFSQKIQKYDSLRGTRCLVESLNLNQKYYCRIMAYNDSLSSKWSDVISFTVWNYPAVELISPPNNSIDMDTSIVFKWEPVEEAWDYQFQLFRNIELTIRIEDIHLQETSVLVENLEKGKEYYWSVTYRHDNGIARSKIFCFSTISDSIRLSSPPDNYRYSDILLDFSWEAKENISSYNFQLSEKEDFSVLRISEILDTNTININNLDYGKKLYWKIIGKHDEKEIFSEIFKFTTKLPEVILLKPEDNSYNINTTPKLEWNSTINTESYNLQLTTDENFESIELDEKALSTSYFVTEALDSGITYYWRIKSKNSVSKSNWSEIFSFTTDYPSSVSDISNSFFTISPNPASDYIEISFSNKRLQPFANSGEIEIYDVLGNVVINSVASQTLHRSVSTTERIDISHLPKGVYFVKIGGNIEKFIKN